MTGSARMANLASLTAIVVLSLTAFATAEAGSVEWAGGRTVTATAGGGSDREGSAAGDAADGGGGGGVEGGPAGPAVAATVVTTDPPGTAGTGAGGGGVGAGAPGAAASEPVDGGAVVLVDDTEAGRRGLQALSSLEFPWEERLPGWRIRFRAASDGAYGYTLPDEQLIEMYVRPGQSDELLTHVLAHELGHAVDVTYNDSDDRQAWRQARGLGDQPWWPDDRAADFATGAGDFAECFAAALVGPGSFRSELGDPPTGEQVALILALAEG